MSKQAYSITFAPLPVASNEEIYCDRQAIKLPYTEDFQTLHYHDRYEIGICESGEGVFLFEDSAYCISKNDVFFITPGSRHYSRSLSPDFPCLCRFVYIDAGTMQNLISLVCKGSAKSAYILQNAKKFISPIISPSINPKEAALLTALVEGSQASNTDVSALTELRLALFILEAYAAFTKPSSSPTAQKFRTDSTVSAVAEYIAINYDQNNTVEDLVRLCNLSESQLRRRFTKMYGIPPVAYKNQLRCKIAADLLSKTQMSISEISSHVGYTDVSDFYRAFKKSYGSAPTAYRANQLHDRRKQ